MKKYSFASLVYSSGLLLLLLLISPTVLQAADTTSSIRGKVVSPSGSPVTGTRVEVTDQRTGVLRTFSTNSEGVFLASRLPVGGPYRIVVAEKSLTVQSISLGDAYYLLIDLAESPLIEEVVVYGEATTLSDVAAGPSATFSSHDLATAVAFDRDITDVYGIDPRINIDNQDDGYSVNCGGKHPRFNSISLDGVSHNDRFGLNDNGYSTATGLPFPYDALAQISVELAPFDVTYGSFSACSINAVTRSGTNEWDGNVFFEYTNEDMRGDSIGDGRDFSTADYNDRKYGITLGGPIIEDSLFIFAAYEKTEKPRFLARGHDGQGVGDDRDWLSAADYNRIVSIARTVYDYDPGGSPSDGAQDDEKYMLRVDWNISSRHNAAFIYNYYDGFQDRDSDGDSSEFEFANHFYVKGAESETFTVKLASYWSDAFSTEFFYSKNDLDDSQVTVGPKDFGDFQINIEDPDAQRDARRTVYLGADDSRQANKLSTSTEYLKFSGQYLLGNHVITFGYEREDLEIYNLFVQHSRGGEYNFFDNFDPDELSSILDDDGMPVPCVDLIGAQSKFDGECGLSGIEKFELGRPSQIYYGSGGGTNNAADAVANFSNVLHSFYIQDEIYFLTNDLTIVAGLRYDRFTSSDKPRFNQAFATANNGLRNDVNIDGLSLLMPRLGFTWDPRLDLTLRGGIGLYSGGNPNVWLSNAWSNDGITNVQQRLRNYDASRSILDGTIPLTSNAPGRATPQKLFDDVAAASEADGSTSRLVLIDPSYEQPNEWKLALGGTWRTPWWDITADIDYLHTRVEDAAMYVDLSQTIVGRTTTGVPVYAFTNQENNWMLTNTGRVSESDVFSVVLRKDFDFGLELMLGYAYTDAEDVVPMTSSVAQSNYENLATLDINDPAVGDSNYVVPHRLTLRASWATNLIGDLETRITLMGYASEGQGQSYTMGSDTDGFNDLEGEGRYGRHLLYVPGPNDPHVVFGPDFDMAAFNAFVDREDLGTGFVDRNETHVRWSNRFDIRIDQELPSFIDGTSSRLYLKLYNLGNFLSKEWGHVNDAKFFSQQAVKSSLNDEGQFVFEEFNEGSSVSDVLEQRSLWALRMGLQFEF